MAKGRVATHRMGARDLLLCYSKTNYVTLFDVNLQTAQPGPDRIGGKQAVVTCHPQAEIQSFPSAKLILAKSCWMRKPTPNKDSHRLPSLIVKHSRHIAICAPGDSCK